MSLMAALIMSVLANDKWINRDISSALTRSDGVVFIFFFIVFLYYSFGAAKTIKGLEERAPESQYGILKSSLLIIGGLGGLLLGGSERTGSINLLF